MIILGAPPKDGDYYVASITIKDINFVDIIRWEKPWELFIGINGNLYDEEDILSWDKG